MEVVYVLQSYTKSAKHEINMTFEVKQDNSQTIIVCYSIENLQAMQQQQYQQHLYTMNRIKCVASAHHFYVTLAIMHNHCIQPEQFIRFKITFTSLSLHYV